MSKIRLYNTMTRQIEELRPVREGHIGIYCCGPTVYDYAHIGNLRKYAADDVLVRTLRHAGYEVTHVMNITDVDDKIIRAAPGGIEAIRAYTKPFEEAFFEDIDTLRIQRPTIVCRATEHINEMAEMVKRLVERGHAYESAGSYYFRIESFPDYGKLSRLDMSGIRPGARVDVDEYEKSDVRDFALWKAPKPNEPVWETVIGPGRPGWHIECSAMSIKYLGPEFDIHTGGVDNIFPHHENEIAQARGAGYPFARHWVHHEHLIVEGKKMAKSLGNFYTLRDLLKRGADPLAIRYLYVSAHYRSQLNFTFAGLEQAKRTVDSLHNFLDRVEDLLASGEPLGPGGTLGPRAETLREQFFQAMYNDLQTPQAVARMHDLVSETNAAIQSGSASREELEQVLAAMREFDQILAVLEHEREMLDEEIAALIAEREEARRKKDYARADEIREQLARQGIILEDTPQGTRWRRASS